MKTKLLLLVLVLLMFTQCSDDDAVAPVTPEEPVEEIPVGKAESDDLIIEGKITEETEDGYKAEGTLYVEVGDQKAEVVSGAFTVTNDAEGNLMSIAGTGTAQMPDLGSFQSFVSSSSEEASF